MRKLAALLGVFGLILVGCASDDPLEDTSARSAERATASPTTHDVAIGDKFFAPTVLTISVGDTIRWINEGDAHNTTSGPVGDPDGLWESGFMTGGDSFSRTFDTAGTFQYFCTFHEEEMQATVIVEG